MIQVLPIQNFNGFGNGKQLLTVTQTQVGTPGEYFYSQGMSKSQFGIVPNWNIAKVKDNADLSGMTLVNWFTQGKVSANYDFAFDSGGQIYKSGLGLGNWSSIRTVNGIPSHGNGLIVDQTNRLLYANDRYLGKSDGTTFTDNWKDFGASYETTGLRPMDIYEDWVVIGNMNNVALLNVTDDSFNNLGLNLPSGYNAAALRAGRTGILVGLNFNNRGAVLLWNAFADRSLAPWIWYNANIKCILPYGDGWIVITSRGIYQTNGYTSTPLIETTPDARKNKSSILSNLLPQGAEIIENYLVFWGNFGDYNRQLAGLYLFDLNTKLFEFAPVSNGVTYGVTGGAIFFDNNFTTHLSYTTDNPAKKFIGRLDNSNPTRAQFITEPLGQGTDDKIAEGAKFSIDLHSKQTTTPAITFDMSVKVASLKRNIWNYVQTKAVSTQADVLKVDATLYTYIATQGDEVTILEGVNAGQVRHISSISNAGTTNEQWTLDSVLPSNTESGVNISVSSFKLVKKYSNSNLTSLKDLYFDISNKLRGKRFLIKVLLENMASNLELEITDGQFIYDDKGPQKG
jgi:hypothetical protein